ncbi:toll/interleukin-1 receptor domain-containing protein [Amycolatopsis circi]|uniref:toll/interleukin-1 receptor domain-containing protein n=1 Tax=Amycolatopsis circi TaxID=871959 RepID=UPI0013BE9A8A|nr:toll/interleukin-1 receptor domain-containing protein [Amycolatopsis circi]
MPDWDVFVSYDRTDAAAVQRIAAALEGAGLRVFLDTEEIRPFDSIPGRLGQALGESKVLLAYYSRSYGSRRACQEEFTTAYLAGPEHVLAVNPEPSSQHLAPRELLDVLLPGHPATKPGLSALADAVRRRVADAPGPIGEPGMAAGWSAPPKFTGRWKELWEIHSILRGGGTAVVHGVLDIGKTTLAQAYVQQFGQAYRTVFAGHSPAATVGDLVVLDDVSSPPEPLPAGVPVLLLTRDRRLAKLGTAVELTDLREDELDLTAELRTAAEGSTGLARRLAEQFSGSTETVLDRLHRRQSPLLDPLAERLLPAVEGAWDLARVLAAASPVPLTRDAVADILAEAGIGTDLDAEFATLLAAGVVVGGLGEFTLPHAFQIVVRGRDPRPARAEQVRQATIALLKNQARPRHTVVPARRRSEIDEAERRAAHQILNELKSRVALRELPDGEGLLRSALSSLYALFGSLRQITGGIDQDALRPSTSVRPGLGTLVSRLQEEILPRFLTYWHTRLDDHHDVRPPGIGSREHELAWPLQAQLRSDLATLQAEVAEVADELAVLSGNPLN